MTSCWNRSGGATSNSKEPNRLLAIFLPCRAPHARPGKRGPAPTQLSAGKHRRKGGSISAMYQVIKGAARASARTRAGAMVVQRLRDWLRTRRLVTNYLALPRSERTRILSADQGQYVVGTRNAATRDAWVASALAALPAGA